MAIGGVGVAVLATGAADTTMADTIGKEPEEKFLSKLNQRTFESGMGVGAPRGMVEGPGRALDGGE